MDLSYNRSYSPVPPPCPSPQLKPQPLPTPPVYARRPSLTPSSREHLPPKLKMKPSAAASSDSLVFSLKEAMVAGSPSSRRFSDHDFLQGASTSDYTLDRRPRTADVGRSFVSLPSPASPSFKRKHRRSDSITHTTELSLSLPTSRSLARKRTRSPSGRTGISESEAPPPVPPLPPLPPKRGGCTRAFLAKKLPPIRIPELGLGLDEKLRSPLSPLFSGTHSRRRRSHPKESDLEATSFLHMSPKRDAKRGPARASLGGPLTGCFSVRASHSLPDIKAAARRRSNSSFTSRIFRLGTQQVVH